MPAWPSFWSHIPESDRPLLRHCIAELLTRGSIIGDQGSARELFLLARDQYLRELSEYFSVLNIEIVADPDHFILQARPIPGECGLVSTFTKDESLLVLALWRVYDEARSERPSAAVIVTANELWQKLRVFFDKIEPPTESHLEKMLAKLRRKRLVRYQRADDANRFGDSLIEVLPTLPRAIPFESLASWQAQAELYAAGPAPGEPGSR